MQFFIEKNYISFTNDLSTNGRCHNSYKRVRTMCACKRNYHGGVGAGGYGHAPHLPWKQKQRRSDRYLSCCASLLPCLACPVLYVETIFLLLHISLLFFSPSSKYTTSHLTKIQITRQGSLLFVLNFRQSLKFLLVGHCIYGLLSRHVLDELGTLLIP